MVGVTALEASDRMVIQELADRIQMGGQDKPDQPGLGPRMPLSHHITSSEIQRAGYRLLLLSPHKVRAVWRRVGVEDAKIEECWPTWIQQCQKWLEPSNPFGRDNELPQTHLFEDLGREV
jgi:hypothetical protein